MRLFIAIDLSENQRQAVHILQQRLAAYLDGVKWTRTQGLHLTLKFIGEVNEGRVPDINAAMEQAAAGVSPFVLRLGRSGVFPDPKNARVLWIGLTQGVTALQSITARLEGSLLERGFAAERQKYVPHLTLGRLRYSLPPARIRQFIESEKDFETETAPVKAIILYQSDLTRQGAVYTALKETLLSQKCRKNLFDQE